MIKVGGKPLTRAELSVGAAVLIGPSKHTHAAPFSQDIWEVVGFTEVAVVVRAIPLTVDPTKGQYLVWHHAFDFYNADHLVKQLKHEAKKNVAA